MILQQIQKPDGRSKAYADMYLHQKGRTLVLDGYYNLFCAEKWHTYTRLERLWLQLRAPEPGQVRVVSEQGCLCSADLDENSELCLDIPEWQRCQFLWVEWEPRRTENAKSAGEATHSEISMNEEGLDRTGTSKAEEGPIYIEFPKIEEVFSAFPSGHFFTMDESYEVDERDEADRPGEQDKLDQPSEPADRIRLAANICTFRREAAVEENIRRLREQILDNPASPIYGKLDIFITDNGQTLDSSTEPFVHENIFVFPNKNAGGSGGFARGLMEINERKAQRGLTHVIFLDDDAQVDAEAFVRTLALLTLLKPEYRAACIAGELLDLDRPYILNEAGALYHKGLSEIPCRGTDLRSLTEVKEAEQIRRVDYAGWWYACYPLQVAHADNLPLPFFVHFDDIEYGLRNNNGIIYLNGICVHHANFDKRFIQTNFFYDTRNRLVTNALRVPDVTRAYETVFLKNAVLYDLLRYFYSNTQLLTQAVRDFCLGAGGFSRIDPAEHNDKVRQIAESFLPFEELTDDPQLIKRLKDYAKRCREGEAPQELVGKMLYRLTLNGWLLPARRDKEPTLCSVYHPDLRELFRARTGILVDPYSERGLIVRKSYRIVLRALLDWTRTNALLKKRYEASAESFRRHEKRLESRKQWQHYLGIERTDCGKMQE